MHREAMRPNAQITVAMQARMWTTPQAHDVTERGSGQQPTAAAGNACLARDARLWMTPNVPTGGRSVPPELVASKGMTDDGKKRTVGLESQSKYWATPDCNTSTYSNGKMGPNIREQAAMWMTPTSGPRDASCTYEAAHAAMTRGNYHQDSLSFQVYRWTTPRGTDGTKGGPNQAGSKGDLMLPSAAAQWPTPNVCSPNSMRGAAQDPAKRKAQGHQVNLQDVAAYWPTPAARDAKGANSQTHCTETGGGQEAHGPTEQLRRPLFAPGPADAAWPDILARWPWLAPAIDKTAESVLHGMADGLASGMDFSNRAARLKCCGNGVVPLQAAAAAVVLVRRMMEAA